MKKTIVFLGLSMLLVTTSLFSQSANNQKNTSESYGFLIAYSWNEYHVINGVYIKKSSASEWDQKNYTSQIGSGKKASIALPPGLYDVKLVLRSNSAVPPVVEMSNVLIKADCSTQIDSRGGVEKPNCGAPKKDRRDND